MNSEGSMAMANEDVMAHRFELAGLGRAPFRFTGMNEKVFVAYPGGPEKAGSCCDYCPASIRFEFWVESADGKRFKVGCDCIRKVGDAGLKRQIAAAERDMKARQKAAKVAREQVRIAEAVRLLAGPVGERLAAEAHSRGFVNRETGAPLSRLAEVKWLLEHSGHAGKLATAKVIEAFGALAK
jgi:hypothetical protein